MNGSRVRGAAIGGVIACGLLMAGAGGVGVAAATAAPDDAAAPRSDRAREHPGRSLKPSTTRKDRSSGAENRRNNVGDARSTPGKRGGDPVSPRSRQQRAEFDGSGPGYAPGRDRKSGTRGTFGAASLGTSEGGGIATGLPRNGWLRPGPGPDNPGKPWRPAKPQLPRGGGWPPGWPCPGSGGGSDPQEPAPAQAVVVERDGVGDFQFQRGQALRRVAANTANTAEPSVPAELSERLLERAAPISPQPAPAVVAPPPAAAPPMLPPVVFTPSAPEAAQPAVAPPPLRPAAPPAAPRDSAAERVSTEAAAYRAGYPEYLRGAAMAEVAGLALPGLAGLMALTAAGGVVGYRQAKAGHLVRAAGTARFLQ